MAGESQIAFACCLLGRWCFHDARCKKKKKTWDEIQLRKGKRRGCKKKSE
jgi:hypothetical protein